MEDLDTLDEEIEVFVEEQQKEREEPYSYGLALATGEFDI